MYDKSKKYHLSFNEENTGCSSTRKKKALVGVGIQIIQTLVRQPQETFEN